MCSSQEVMEEPQIVGGKGIGESVRERPRAHGRRGVQSGGRRVHTGWMTRFLRSLRLVGCIMSPAQQLVQWRIYTRCIPRHTVRTRMRPRLLTLDSPGFATQTTVAGLCMRPLRPTRLLHHQDRLGRREFIHHW